MKYNNTQKIQEHYDLASPYYEKLWGQHIHHGYWLTGKENKEEASQNLIELLINKSDLKNKSKVLDIGCGIGGTSMYLAKEYGCDVTGITISPVQVEMATKTASKLKIKNKPSFKVMDANNITLNEKYDIIWSVEMISHLNNRENLFKRASELLKPGGRMCITDWLADDNLDKASKIKYIDPIEKGMLVSLPTLTEYKEHLDNNGLRLIYYEDISSKVAKTWDITSEAIKNKALWSLAREHSKEFIEFLKSFKAMRNGFKSGAFRYPAMVLEKKK
jgi:tocopherol O-methyltransferase